MPANPPELANDSLRSRYGVQSGTEGEPLVSVVITSYNSERWLGQALEGVLDQRTSFPVEVVLADDCSQDGTVAVARDYERRYPDLLRILDRDQNVGTQRNYYDAFERARGRYTAWLDADDYWTDPEKLEVQVQAMEQHADVAVCGHYVRWVTRGSNGEVKRERFPELPAGRHGLREILHRNFLPSPSVMFRSGLHRELPAWYFEVSPVTDWPLHIAGALRGDILLLDRIMADYTLNATSAFWGQGTQRWYQSDADFYNRLETTVPAQYKRLVRFEKGKRYEALAYHLRQAGDFAGSRRAAVKAFLAPAWNDDVRSKCKGLFAAVVREAQWRLRRLWGRKQLAAEEG